MTALRRLWPESLVLLALGLLDLASTVYLVHRGLAIEANPLLAPYLELGVEWFLVAKAVLLCLIPIGMVEWFRERWPERESRLRYILRAGLALYVLAYIVGGIGVNW